MGLGRGAAGRDRMGVRGGGASNVGWGRGRVAQGLSGNAEGGGCLADRVYSSFRQTLHHSIESSSPPERERGGSPFSLTDIEDGSRHDRAKAFKYGRPRGWPRHALLPGAISRAGIPIPRRRVMAWTVGTRGWRT